MSSELEVPVLHAPFRVTTANQRALLGDGCCLVVWFVLSAHLDIVHDSNVLLELDSDRGPFCGPANPEPCPFGRASAHCLAIVLVTPMLGPSGAGADLLARQH